MPEELQGHNFAIVDEVNSILIDEARTPLIISGAIEDKSGLYLTVDKFIPSSARSISNSTRKCAPPFSTTMATS